MRGDMWQEATKRRNRPGRPRIATRIQRFIKEQADKGLTPAEIERALRGAKNVERHEIPDRRTIQRYVRRYQPPDPSAPWSLEEAEAEDAALILPVLEKALRVTDGRFTLSHAQAGWFSKVARAAPDLSTRGVYWTARAYHRRAALGENTDDLIIFLAFAPWRSVERYRLFEDWVKRFRPAWVVEGEPETFETAHGTVFELQAPMPDAEAMEIAHSIAVESVIWADETRERRKRGEASAVDPFGLTDSRLGFWEVDKPKGDDDDKTGE